MIKCKFKIVFILIIIVISLVYLGFGLFDLNSVLAFNPAYNPTPSNNATGVSIMPDLGFYTASDNSSDSYYIINVWKDSNGSLISSYTMSVINVPDNSNTSVSVPFRDWSNSVLEENTRYRWQVFHCSDLVGDCNDDPSLPNYADTWYFTTGSIFSVTNPNHTQNTLSSINWDWNDMSNVSYYDIRYTNGFVINSSPILVSSYLLSNLNRNTNYSVQVRACNNEGVIMCSSWSSSETAYTSIEAPSGVLFGTVTDTSIQAKANGTFSNLTSGNSKIQIQNVTTGTTLECTNCNNYLTFTGLQACTTYSFKARACNGDCKNDGTGDYTDWTSEVTKKTSGCAQPDFTVSKVGSGWASTVCKGTQQIYGYRVNNAGTASGGYFYNRLYVNDSYVSGQQEFVSTSIISGQYWPSSQGYTCADIGTMCWTPSATGNYNVVIKADSGNSANTLDCSSGSGGAVTETDETNNCSTSFSVNVIDVPSAPGTPTFSNIGKTSATISWTSASYASSYDIYRCAGAGCTRPSSPTYTGVTSPYTDTGLACGTQYTYWIKANNQCGGTFSNSASLTTSACDRPDLIVTDVNTSSPLCANSNTTLYATVKNQGTAISPDSLTRIAFEQSGAVKASCIASTPSLDFSAETGNTASVNCSLTAPAAGTYDLSGEADYDSSISELDENNNKRTETGFIISDSPPSPGNFRHTGNGTSGGSLYIDWAWNDVSGESSYEFYISNNGTTYTLLSTLAANTTSYRSSKDANNANYNYNTRYWARVYAKNACGAPYSSASAYTSIQSPTGVSISNITTSSVDVSAQGTFTNLSVGSSGIQYRLTNTNSCTSGVISDSGWYQSTSAHRFTGLSSNTTYYVCTRSRNAEGDTNSWIGPASFTTKENTPPVVSVNGAPASCQNTDATMTLSCTDSGSGCNTSRDGYRIYSSNPASCPTSFSNYTSYTGSVTISSYSWVCGYGEDNDGNIDTDGPVEFKVDKTNPTYTSFTAVSNNCEQATLTVSGASDSGGCGLSSTAYRFSKDNGSTWTGWQSSNTYTYNNLTGGQSYTFRAQIRDNAGNITTTGSQSVTPQACLTAPAAPSNLTFTNVQKTAMTLNWNDNSNNEDGFRIYRNTSNVKPSSAIATLAANTTAYTDSSLNCETTYYWWVEAYNAAGANDVSGTRSTLACGSGPTLSANPSSSGGWVNSPVSITLGVSDSDGVSSARYRWDAQANSTSGTLFNDGDVISSPCPSDSTLYMWAVDNLGVESTASFGQYQCDDRNPSISSFTVDGVDRFNDPVSNTDGTPTISWNVSDTGGSGVATVEIYKKVGTSGSWQVLYTTSQTSGSYTDSVADGTYYYGIHVTDNAGNCTLESGSACSTNNGDPIQVNVNTVQPDFSVSASPSSVSVVQGGSSASVTVTVSSTGGFSQRVDLSDDCSASSLSCSWSQTSCTPSPNSSCSVTLYIGSGTANTGNYTVTVTGSATGYSDKTTVVSVNVSSAPDTQSPTVDVSANPSSVTTVWQNTDAEAQVACSDSGTGCDTSSYRLAEFTSSGSCPTTYSSYTLTSPYTVTTNRWYCAAAKDLSGNTGFSSSRVEFKVDKELPSVDLFTVEGAGTGQSVVISTANNYPTVKWSSSDSISGVSKVELYRAKYSSLGCNDTDKSGCSWSVVWTDTSASNTTGRDDTSVSNNTTYYYGIHVTDNANNCTLENNVACGGVGNPVKVTINWPIPDFSLSNNGPIQIQPGGTSKDVIITVSSQNGFSEIVSLSDNCSSSGLTCSWPQGASCQPPADSTCSKTLRIGAASGVSAGSYTVTVTGSATGYTDKTTDVGVNVTSVSDNIYPSIDSFSVSYEDGSNDTVYNNTLTLTAGDPRVNWQTSDNQGVASVDIFRGIDTNNNNSPDSWTKITTSSSAQGSYTDANLTEGTYWYRIEATDTGGNCIDEQGQDCVSGTNITGRSTVGPIKVVVDRTVADFVWCSKSATDVQFTDKSTGGGSTTISSWSWDFGDNSCPGPADCSQQNPLHTYSSGGANGAYQESGGLVVIEAENWDDNISRGGYSWTAQTSYAGYSGTGYMEAQPNSGTEIATNYTTSSPELRYTINFTTTGTYYVWVRGNANTNAWPGTNDSVHVGLNGNAVSTSESMTDDDGSNRAWEGSFGWSQDRMYTTEVATINIPSSGVYTLNVWMREDGFRFDKIILTTDSNFVPTGTGPAESTKSTDTFNVKLTVTDSQGGSATSNTQTVKLNTNFCPANSTPSVPVLSGPASPGYRGVSYTFTANSTDPDGDQITYEFDWNNDDVADTSVGPVNSGQDGQASTSFNTLGNKCIRARAKDALSTSSWSACYNFNIENRDPNTPSNPNPSDGAVSVSLYTDFSFSGGDPDGDLDNLVYTITIYDGLGQLFGSTPVSKTVKGGTTSITFTNSEIGGPLSANDNYTWIISVDDGIGGQVTGPTWSFTTGDGCTPKEPTAVVPWVCNADNTANVTWDWSPGISGASDYYLQVSLNDSTFNSANLVYDGTTGGSTKYTLSNLQASGGTTYYARVRSVSSSCGISNWSNVSQINVSCGLTAEYEYCRPDPSGSPTTVSFFDQSSGGATPYTWSWDFGDGSPQSTQQHPTHTFVDNSSNWWNTSWKRRRKITFDNSAQTENLVNFPVLITLNGARIDYTQTQNNGQDIRFVDADGTTVLDYEIEKWDETGTSYVWVKVPQIDGSSNTDYIWMYYGNPSAADAQNPAGVWSNGYEAVWHLSEIPSGATDEIKDSSGNNRHGTTVGMDANDQVSGTADGSLDFDGIDDRVDTKNFMSSGVTQLTLEAWVYKTASKDARIIYKNNAGNVSNPVFGLASWPNSSNGTETIRCRVRPQGTTGRDIRVDNIPLNTWTYVACVYTGSSLVVYKNGTNVGSTAVSGTLDPTDDVVVLAQNEAGSSVDRYWPGRIDEARISSVARSADWMKAQYLSMSDSFFNLSASFVEESLSSAGGSGIYQVTLTTTDAYGLTDSVQKSIDVSTAPSCDFDIISVTPSTCVSTTISWEKATGADKYNIYRSETGPNGTYVLVGSIDAQDTLYCSSAATNCSWDDTGLKQRTQYYYKVEVVRFDSATAENANGPQGVVTDSCTPQNLVASDDLCGKIDISWKEPLGGLGTNKTEFNDKFTDADGTELSLHTPTDQGSGWTKVMGNNTMTIISNRLTPSASCGSGDSVFYWTDNIMTKPDYEVSAVQVNGGTGDNYNILAVRVQDTDSNGVPDAMYAFKWNETNGINSPGLYKYSGGAWTNLADITNTSITDGSRIIFRAQGNTLSVVVDNGITQNTILQYTDNNNPITDAGRAGIGAGSVITLGEGCSGQILDDFTVVVYGGKYRLYRSTSSAGTFSPIADTISTSYSDKDIVLDSRYYYYVTSIVEGAESDPSNTDSGVSYCFRGPVYIER